MWINLRAGASREATNIILRGIRIIILAAVAVVCNAVRAAAGLTVTVAPNQLGIPDDIRTVYQQQRIDPTLDQTVCCPKCFTLHSRPIPWLCEWRETPRAWKCNTPLWKTQNTSRGTKMVPDRLYTTQRLDAWLEFFLGRQEIEDALQRTHTQAPAPLGGTMSDVFDSPAWAYTRSYRQTPYHLVFALYIDWFNPYTNKIAGKVISCGAIVLYCLSLPPEIRYLPENVFVVGLTPPPSMPDFVSISHILNPHVDDILRYDSASSPRR
ncbi:hypothetical protein CYLTODRAFT_480817 [Cylindrobasidium torrendii FP15055 ss-10]|uniref:Uncharacterized protein n=1 Tax=Cylindrobasidium torrendii FP15055 ss-10 TaxID=1314674 RepID=A0A0D7AS40_9AGAR|nr:hypothetical protein CYLTODRAFT_480817 [Cylindrobasidium torrendii FP15055 ss-10]